MPSGQRFRITIKGVKYDLSPIQWELIKAKSISAKQVEANIQSINGLVTAGLLKVLRGEYVRTVNGEQFVEEMKAKLKTKAKAASAE